MQAGRAGDAGQWVGGVNHHGDDGDAGAWTASAAGIPSRRGLPPLWDHVDVVVDDGFGGGGGGDHYRVLATKNKSLQGGV